MTNTHHRHFSTTDLSAGTLTAVAALKEESNEVVDTADILYSEVSYNASADTFTFVMPDEDVILAVSEDVELGTMLLAVASSGNWDDQTDVEAGSYYYYSDGTLHPFNSVMGSGGNDSYKYVRYKVDVQGGQLCKDVSVGDGHGGGIR